MLTRRRILKRLDQDNYSDLHWSSCHRYLLFLVLQQISLQRADRSQQSTKGDKFILDLEALKTKKYRKV